MKTKLTNLLKISFVLCGILLLSNSCTEEKYIENPGHETQWDVLFFTVSGNQWEWDNQGEFYYCVKSVSALTKDKAIDGSVQAALVFPNNIYKPLENTEYYFEIVNPPSNGYYFSETVSFIYGPGMVEFRVKASDLYDNSPTNYSPKGMEFKVTIIY